MEMEHRTIIAATMITAPSSTKYNAWERNPKIHQTKKGKQWYIVVLSQVRKEGVPHQCGPTSSHA